MFVRQHQDNHSAQHARKLIGYTLLGLLIAIVLLSFAALLLIDLQHHMVDQTVVAAIRSRGDAERLATILKIASEASEADANRLAVLLNIVFGPVVTLLGSVTGFYFGRSRAQSPD